MQSVIFRTHGFLNGSGHGIAERGHARAAVAVLFLIELIFAMPANAGYIQTNLVSDGGVSGTATDPALVNPWGMAASSGSPLWVSDNGTGLATVYNGLGVKQGLTVSIPPIGGTDAAKPTGQVFNSSSTFNGDSFIFATENGTISGWRGSLGTTTELLFDNSTNGAVYKGLAIGGIAANTYLYAANFNSGQIDVFKDNAAPSLPGSFTDPTLPSGYAPFNIQHIGSSLFVTYALQDGTKKNDVAGAGNGYVDEFGLNGNFIRRVISNGPLNSPWGLTYAPSTFGQFSNALLVGNSGDGLINAFDVLTGTFLGSLADLTNTPLAIDGLRGLLFGNGGNGGQTNELFFTAGPNEGTDGLFGKITTTDAPASVPEPATFGLFIAGLTALLRARFRSLRKKLV